MGIPPQKALGIREFRDPFGQPDREQGMPLWERAKKEQEHTEDIRDPLHVTENQHERGNWMEVPRLEGGQKDEVIISENEMVIFGHDSKDGGRVQITTSERVEKTRAAAERVSRMRDEFSRQVAAFERLGVQKGDFSSEQLLRMQDSIIVEALKRDQPSVVMNELLRSVARADERETQVSVMKLSAKIHALESALDAVDAPTREVLEAELHVVRQQMYKARRGLHPEATQEELLALADDVQGYLEPVNWRPLEEPSLHELQGRLGELNALMDEQNVAGEFDPIAELRWYALNRERDEYKFMVKAAELRETQSWLYDSDYGSSVEVPWDVKLLRAGKAMEKAENSVGVHRQRETSVYRMLRDAYVDTESQDQMVRAVDTILKDASAPESLREAARLLQKEVRAQRLPAPEALLKRREQVREQRVEQQQGEREERVRKAASERTSPLERVFMDVQPIVEDRVFQKDFVKERTAVIENELGMEERDVIRLHKAMETFNYHANRLHPDLRTKLPFTWKEFISAEPHETTEPPKGLFRRMQYRVKEQFSPRRKMLRQFKREMKRLPSHKRKTFEMLLGNEVLKLIGL